MPLSRRRWMRHRINAKKALKSSLGMVCAALIGAGIASHFSSRDAVALTVTQQNYALVQQFMVSGQQVNTTFQAFNDSLVDAQEAGLSDTPEVRAARKSLRDAIGQHSSQAYLDQAVLGPAAADYIDRLAKFRDLVDKTTAPADAMPMAQVGMDLISQRQKLADQATKRLGLAT